MLFAVKSHTDILCENLIFLRVCRLIFFVHGSCIAPFCRAVFFAPAVVAAGGKIYADSKPVHAKQNEDSFQTVPAKLYFEGVVHCRRKPGKDFGQSPACGRGNQKSQPHHGENPEQAKHKRIIPALHRVVSPFL